MNDVKVGFGATEPLAAEMTLRDWFAGQAMARYPYPGEGVDDVDQLAEWCGIDADAMMDERAEHSQPQKVTQNPPPAEKNP